MRQLNKCFPNFNVENAPQKKPTGTTETMIIGPYYIFADGNGFKGSLLDDYLAAGYYRMLHTVFTVHHTQVTKEGDAMPVFWLRTAVKKITENNKAAAIRKKCAAFTVVYTSAGITSETEDLYGRYQQAVDFDTGGGCYDCMHDSVVDNPFDSRMIEIRDGHKLIAAGYFDLGQTAITGILNFYDPLYKKYSLGKYLMLKKIDWALANNLEWYYTGYLSTGTGKFDYKLFPDLSAMEVFLPVEQAWVPFTSIGKTGLTGYWPDYLLHYFKS